ncbi:polysaccharide pyruvyl transferase family protein [Gluconobacter kondonii]|uniref:polysaccharide pyruvyl transferase family protein n=1 Tax=Gluconobacter kondonii TaxID=941463 RepID=UPI001B8BD9F8|nr:polysaccharide pyruvyl transferase family protein [Gluconobacter kondonii]MBS1078948.1 polysaccharide pyruvyl transferase family protein [Gluconobacter kondonii]
MNENYKNIRQAVREEIWNNVKLIESLKHFIENDAAFYPGYGNLGDGLIALGTLDLFEDLGLSPKCIEGRSKETFSGYNYIVMGGGGGWVKGLWETYLEQTITFLQNGGQLLILPTSFFGFGSEFVPYADQMTIFCREQTSYEELLRQGMPKDRIFVCSDMAFYTKEKHFSDLEVKGEYPVLQIFRLDEEGGRKAPPRTSVDLPLLFNDVQWTSIEQCVKPLRAVAGLISQFECVETDRLHMAVLATILGKTVRLEPSSYFKIKAIFDYTLHRFPAVSFGDRSSDYIIAEQGIRSEARLLRNTVRRLNLDRQAEWEQRVFVLKQNDALLLRLEKLQKKLRETSDEKDIEIKKREDLVKLEQNRCENLIYKVSNLEYEIECKQRNFSFSNKELEMIKSSRLYRLSERYYSVFRLPIFGFILRFFRKVIIE